MKRRNLIVGAVAAGVAPAVLRGGAMAQDALKMRISLDTSATHTRTVQMTRFAAELNKRAGGKLHAEVFHSAQLFRDRDVAKALRQGGTEMGVPGPWNLTGLEPNVDVFQTPAFYGRVREEIYKVSDGDIGKDLNGRLEKKIGVHVPGKWLDLGSAHTFSTKTPLNSSDDMKGLKVRTSGGKGQFVRVKFFGGIPNFTAWPDVPLALSQGTFDALLTTTESCVSAKLWESGIRFNVQDNHFFAQYIPMISAAFWGKLSADLQKQITTTWADMIGGFRDEMAKSQAHALDVVKEKGIKVVEPSKADIEAARKRLMATLDDVTKELGLEAALVAKAGAALGIGGKA
ncbi:MAG: TRAP transporter substrate-binding protein DctP [Alphaproteobacteria bacterium]|nr:TRAP transporter substrate-binding protein DctP [Alphaproteobacteria bacterium]MCW5742466.1 TRAP transporter substrate-binding protein DctP [Alphaproteobacteria bacterium]